MAVTEQLRFCKIPIRRARTINPGESINLYSSNSFAGDFVQIEVAGETSRLLTGPIRGEVTIERKQIFPPTGSSQWRSVDHLRYPGDSRIIKTRLPGLTHKITKGRFTY